jgi:hypothetical protein
MLYATGPAGLATLVRGSSRRIKIMRFRPANIRRINRRSNLPRLRLARPSKNSKSNDNDKNNPTDAQALTGSLHIRAFLGVCRPNLVVSHPFRRKTRNGWGTEVYS